MVEIVLGLLHLGSCGSGIGRRGQRGHAEVEGCGAVFWCSCSAWRQCTAQGSSKTGWAFEGAVQDLTVERFLPPGNRRETRQQIREAACARVSIQIMLFQRACLLSVTQGYSALPAPQGELHSTALPERETQLSHRLQKDSSRLIISEAISWPFLPPLECGFQCPGICWLNVVAGVSNGY